jgi:hypothetical protein
MLLFLMFAIIFSLTYLTLSNSDKIINNYPDYKGEDLFDEKL